MKIGQNKEPPRIKLGEGTEGYELEVIEVRVNATTRDRFTLFTWQVAAGITSLTAYNFIVTTFT
jgi:hypothetical protein